MQTLWAEFTKMNVEMQKMGELIKKLVKAVDELEENVERLDISWSGEANTQFMLAFYEDFNKMRNIIEDMLNYKKRFRCIISEYQQTELSIKQRVKELKI